jgi:DNA modification methylase
MPSAPVTLHWQRHWQQPISTARLTPAQPRPATVRLFDGDNLSVLELLSRELEGQVTLAYLDPPFLTGRAHERVTRRKGGNGELVRETAHAFDDRWDGMAHYLDALAPRLERVFRCLSADGSLVLHVDPKTSHYAKVLCDELFGADNFASEIIWRYRRWPAKTANFQRVHDVLLRFTKTPGGAAKFVQCYEPLAPSTLRTWGTGKQRAVLDAAGRRRRSSTTETASPGTPLGDVWEIGIVAPVARERTGYPTQKPEALLERLISTLTSVGDLVLDPYAGSGTSLAVAARLKRRAVGVDQSDAALDVIRERLRAAEVSFSEQRLVLQREASLAS